MNLPETAKQWEQVKKMFLKDYKVEDTPEVWTFILSQLQNTTMPKLVFSPQEIFAHYKRWKIAKVLQDEKTVYIEQLKAKLEEKLKALSEAEDEGTSPQPNGSSMPSRPPANSGEVPALQETTTGVVHSPS